MTPSTVSDFIFDIFFEFLRSNCTDAHALAEFHLYNLKIAKSCNMTPSTVSDFIFFKFLDFFGPFPVSFMKNVRAVFEKPIISGEKPVKYRKSKKAALQRNAQ